MPETRVQFPDEPRQGPPKPFKPTPLPDHYMCTWCWTALLTCMLNNGCMKIAKMQHVKNICIAVLQYPPPSPVIIGTEADTELMSIKPIVFSLNTMLSSTDPSKTHFHPSTVTHLASLGAIC